MYMRSDCLGDAAKKEYALETLRTSYSWLAGKKGI